VRRELYSILAFAFCAVSIWLTLKQRSDTAIWFFVFGLYCRLKADIADECGRR